MLFVNAKINIGLQIIGKRADGYHDLQTVFYPIGLYAGTAVNPVPFCDMLEIYPGTEKTTDKKENGISGNILPEIKLRGRRVDCVLEKNLVYKAAKIFCEETGADFSGYELILEKHLPDGAGLGGGSADASFTLRMLGDIYNERKENSCKLTDEDLEDMAFHLGADCPFFIKNRPAYAEGIGETLTPLGLDLSGYWLVVIKPSIYISTRDAFAGVRPRPGKFDLRLLPELPVEKWKEVVINDFEESVFPQHPKIARIKERLYQLGALYSSMSGSGSSVYAIYGDYRKATDAIAEYKNRATIEGSYLLKL